MYCALKHRVANPHLDGDALDFLDALNTLGNGGTVIIDAATLAI